MGKIKTRIGSFKVVKTRIGLRDYHFVRDMRVRGAYSKGAFISNKDGSVKLFKTKTAAVNAAKRR